MLEQFDQYPGLKLPEPLSLEDTDRLNELQSNERQFALLLLDKGMIVYPQPEIENCTARPDFFVVNPNRGTGKILEITFLPKDKDARGKVGNGKNKKRGKVKGIKDRRKETILRKERQKEELENCGIPCVFLYRENQEKIKDYIWPTLF